MADVRPFRGIRYNLSKVGRQDDVVSQPYDRITDEMRDGYYAKSEYNIARIIKNRPEREDSDRENVYTRAKAYRDRWFRDKVLTQDEKPVFYVYHQEFEAPGIGKKTRRGFACIIRLVPFEAGIVLPHEKTLSKPKVDRMSLMRATKTNFGQIFMLYPDEKNEVYQVLDPLAKGEPEMEAVEEGSVKHRVWAVDDERAIAEVTELMRDKSLFIADGHHRYETALDYMEERKTENPSHTGEEPYNFRMVTLVGMEDPGLFILPTHRLVHSLSSFSLQGFLKKCAQYFNVKESGDLAGTLDEMRKVKEAHTFGIYSAGKFWVLTLKSGSGWEKLLPTDRSEDWRKLDVVVLHQVVIEELLGISEEKVTTQENIRYLRNPEVGTGTVDSDEAQLLLMMNPTKVSQVKAVASKMEKMPQKSTDFFPKLISGLVMNPLT